MSSSLTADVKAKPAWAKPNLVEIDASDISEKIYNYCGLSFRVIIVA